MYCFKITPNKGYTHGCAIVAAHNDQEAIKTYCAVSEYNNYTYDEFDCTCNIVDKLHYDTEVPKVIIDSIDDE